MAAEEGVFAKLANEVLEAAEHIVTRVEEGASAILHGKLPEDGSNDMKIDADPSAGDDDKDPLMDMDDVDMGGSPLEGMAESVLSDIMGGQVRIIHYCFYLTVLFIHENTDARFAFNTPSMHVGWPTNTNGSHSCLSSCRQLDRTLYSFLIVLSCCRLFLVPLGLTTQSILGSSCGHYAVYWHFGAVCRTHQCLCCTKLGGFRDTKLL